MSMINRMLSDLERRGAPRPKVDDAALVAERKPMRRRRAVMSRLFPPLLVVVLIAVAMALWIERGDRLLAAWHSMMAPDTTRTAGGESGDKVDVVAVAGDSGDDTKADEPSATDTDQPETDNGETVDVAALEETEKESRPQTESSESGSETPKKSKVDSEAQFEAQADAETESEAVSRSDTEPKAADDQGEDEAADAMADSGNPEDGRESSVENEAGSAQTLEEMHSLANVDGENRVRKSQSLAPEVRARRRYREATEALRSGEIATARRRLIEALELDPALHEARDLLVALMRRAGDPDAARSLLGEGIERAPARLEYAMPYARLLVDTGELDRAADVLARARPAAADNPGFHALAAAVAQRRGEHEQAARAYTRALELDADNGIWWLGLGISLAAAEHPQEARAAFREARDSGDLDERLDRWAAGRIEELGGEN